MIPNCSKRFILIDGAKDICIELRCLPALELHIALADAYPSNLGPLFIMTTPFYEPFKKFLYEKLNEKWVEDMIVLYEIVYFIQDEFLNSFFENGDIGPIKSNDRG